MMNFSQLQAYLQAYLETNDTKVIEQIPNFMTLALTRISSELRGVVVEASADLLPEPTQPQPAGFMGAVMLLQDGMVSTYASPAAFAGLTNEQGAYYTLLAGQIRVYPEPASTTLLTLTYYQATGDNVSASLPHLLLHCAAAEAELFQGNIQDANTELQLYQADMRSADGWDIQSGPITLGGGLKVTPRMGGVANTPGAGYVKGPSGSTAGNIPLWDGTTGRLLGDGVPVSTFATPADVAALQASLGNAAYATLTTSNIDATAGRVTKVGDGGILNTGNAPAIVSLDTTASMPSGLMRYSAGVTLGTPPTGAALNGSVLIERFSSTIIKQTWTDVVGGSAIAPRTWVRTSSGVNTWGAWAELSTSLNSIGVSQTWQDVSASRALDTIYTNTTGRPIQIKVAALAGENSVMGIFINGSAVGLPGPASIIPENSAIIPNGATYRALNNFGTGAALNWWELR